MNFTYDISRSIIGHMLKSDVLAVFPEKLHETCHSRVLHYFVNLKNIKFYLHLQDRHTSKICVFQLIIEYFELHFQFRLQLVRVFGSPALYQNRHQLGNKTKLISENQWFEFFLNYQHYKVGISVNHFFLFGFFCFIYLSHS